MIDKGYLGSPDLWDGLAAEIDASATRDGCVTCGGTVKGPYYSIASRCAVHGWTGGAMCLPCGESFGEWAARRAVLS